MHVKKLVTATFLLGAAAYGLNWDNALIMGTTPRGKMFYAPGDGVAWGHSECRRPAVSRCFRRGTSRRL